MKLVHALGIFIISLHVLAEPPRPPEHNPGGGGVVGGRAYVITEAELRRLEFLASQIESISCDLNGDLNSPDNFQHPFIFKEYKKLVTSLYGIAAKPDPTKCSEVQSVIESLKRREIGSGNEGNLVFGAFRTYVAPVPFAVRVIVPQNTANTDDALKAEVAKWTMNYKDILGNKFEEINCSGATPRDITNANSVKTVEYSCQLKLRVPKGFKVKENLASDVVKSNEEYYSSLQVNVQRMEELRNSFFAKMVQENEKAPSVFLGMGFGSPGFNISSGTGYNQFMTIRPVMYTLEKE